MADQVTNYKCPACEGPLHFEPKSGMLECEYCDSQFSVEEIEKRYAEKDAKAAAAKKAEDTKEKTEDDWSVTSAAWNGEGMKSYTCPSCGATLICDEHQGSGSCPYCGSPTIVPGQFVDMLKPDYVVPFKYDKKAALDGLKKHYGNRFLLPKEFKEKSHMEEIKGVYVPFWLYDGVSNGNCVYEAIKEEKRRTPKEEIITKKYYRAERKGELTFQKIPADASSKMADDLMDSIEPYNYSELKSFSNAYLAGYYADKYDVSVEDNAVRAVERAKETTRQVLEEDVTGYDSVSPVMENIHVKQGKAYYALMPVWLLTTRWKDQKYTFAMNGQTGKMVGDLPINKGKLWATLAIVIALIIGLTTGLFHWSMTGAVIAAIIVALIVYLCLAAGMKNVGIARTADVYVDREKTKITHRLDLFERQEQRVVPIQQNK